MNSVKDAEILCERDPFPASTLDANGLVRDVWHVRMTFPRFEFEVRLFAADKKEAIFRAGVYYENPAAFSKNVKEYRTK